MEEEFHPKDYPKLCDVSFDKLKRFDRVLNSEGVKGEIFFLYPNDKGHLIEIVLFNSTNAVLKPHDEMTDIHYVGPLQV